MCVRACVRVCVGGGGEVCVWEGGGGGCGVWGGRDEVGRGLWRAGG